MSSVLHLMGPTCAGKSTLIDRLSSIAPNDVFKVEVGKMLRAKHGEAFFAGQAAPAHTQDEAWQMYIDGVKTGITLKKKLILVDGQPRDAQQAREIVKLWKRPDQVSHFLMLWADHATREHRARSTRPAGPNLDLAVARLVNDYRNCCVVLAELGLAEQVVRWIDTTTMDNPNALAEQVLREYA